MDILTILSLIGGGAGSLITITTFITLFCKPLREKFVAWIRKITDKASVDESIKDLNDKIDKLTALVEKTIEQNEELQSEMEKQSLALQASLRDAILDLYYKCTGRGSITMFEKQNLDELYKRYTDLKGNHFVEDCYKEMSALPKKN